VIGNDQLSVNKTEQDSEQINNQILVREAWRKAEDDVSRRKQTEFLLWSKSMLILYNIILLYKFKSTYCL